MSNRQQENEKHPRRAGRGQDAAASVSEREQQLIALVSSQLKPWNELGAEDYDFRGWASNSLNRYALEAGAFYEYARESRKFRGLLLLSDAYRKGPRGEVPIPNFEGLTDYAAEKVLKGWYNVLRELASELGDNLPFGKVTAERIQNALYMDSTSNLPRFYNDESGYFYYRPPVSLAFEADKFRATDQETFLGVKKTVGRTETGKLVRTRRRRIISKSGEEILAIKLNWRALSNQEIADAFGRFAATHRPEKCPEMKPRTRRGRGKEVEITGALDALTALRLLSSFQVKQAMDHYQTSALNRFGEVPDENNFRAKAREALRTLRKFFPFESTPEHRISWHQRHRWVKESG